MNGTDTVTRREVLAAGGALGIGTLAGCSGSGSASSGRVSVLSAGSLSVVFNDVVGPRFTEETGYEYRGEFHGSNAVMRMVLEGQKRPDVIVSADHRLLRDKLQEGETPKSEWDVVFASNSVGLTYAADTDLAARIEDGEPWYRALLETDATIARSDPDLDPLGYRTVMLFRLAEQYYDEPGLADALIERLQVDPEEAHMLAAVETGDRVAAITYRNMAIDHGLQFHGLPDELNFSNPALADRYGSVSYEMDDGHTVEGKPILFNATVSTGADDPEAGREFVGYLLENAHLLAENGLIVDDSFPIPNGPVPDEVLP
ncbi:MAG: extracellular solute-binding protein [Halobacteriota archaeon]